MLGLLDMLEMEDKKRGASILDGPAEIGWSTPK
jgi:hypothetical protein